MNRSSATSNKEGRSLPDNAFDTFVDITFPIGHDNPPLLFPAELLQTISLYVPLELGTP